MDTLRSFFLTVLLGAILGGAIVALLNYQTEPPAIALQNKEETSQEPAPKSNAETIVPRRRAMARSRQPALELMSEARKETTFMPRGDTQSSCQLRGFLKFRDGRIADSITLRWHLSFGPQTKSGLIVTDRQGNFGITIKGVLHQNKQGQLTLTEESIRFGIHADEPALEAAKALLPLDLPRGEYDIGEIIFEQIPLVAMGVVLDDSGEPLGGVKFEFSLREKPGSPPMLWTVCSSTKTGKFEFHQQSLATETSVLITRDGFLPQTLTRSVGDDSWRVVLRRSSHLDGSFPYTKGEIDFALTTADGLVHKQPTKLRKSGGKAEFHFRDMASGPARIEIRVDGIVILDQSIQLQAGRAFRLPGPESH